jgi:ribosome biogenesis GTPase
MGTLAALPTHEPGCAVKEAVENDEIAPERYLSYLNILVSL